MKRMTEIAHDFLKPVLKKGAVCIDATLGQGSDTRFFLEYPVARVFAFDIQQDLIKKAKETIDDPRLILCPISHEYLDQVNDLSRNRQNVSAILFNFGYDPAKKEGIMTESESSLTAVIKAVSMLRLKGRMALVFYPHEEGKIEKERITEELLKAAKEDILGCEMMEVSRPDHDSPSLLLLEKRHSSLLDTLSNPNGSKQHRLGHDFC